MDLNRHGTVSYTHLDVYKRQAEKIEVFFDLPVLSSLDIDLEMILENDRDGYAKFPSVGDEIHFCLGKVERNTVVDYLEKFIEDKSDNLSLIHI